MRTDYPGSKHGKIKSFINRIFHRNLEIRDESGFVKLTLESISQVLWICSTDWEKFYHVNEAYNRVWGKDHLVLYSRPSVWLDSVHQDDVIKVRNAVSESSAVAGVYEFPDYRIVTPDGAVKWIETCVSRVNSGNDELRLSCISTDITRRKIIELDLVKNEQNHLDIINSMQDVFYRTDNSGKFIMMSPSFKKVFGYESTDEVMGRHIEEVVYFHSADRKKFFNDLSRNGSVSDYEVILKKKDGSPVYISTSSHFYYDSDGHVAGVEGIVRDISLRKRAEDMFNKAFHDNPCPMSISDIKTGCYLEVNRAWLETLEFSREEVIGHTPHEIKIYSDQGDRNRIVDAILGSGHISDLEMDFISSTGKKLNGIFYGEVIDVAGKKMLLSIVMNVTGQRMAEKALALSEERFRRLAENAPDVIYRMSIPDGVYEYVSPSAEKVLGYTPEEIYATPRLVAKTIHPDWREYFMHQWSNLLNGEVPPTYEYQVITKTGEMRWLHQRNMIIKDENGSITAIEGIITDFTERKAAENDLRFKNAVLRAEQEVSPDGILIVDHNGKIILYNRQFTEIWGIPDELASRGSDKEVLQSILSMVEDPDIFLNRVKYLYEHRDEKSHEEIIFIDGRIIERYTASIKGNDGEYFGRVWYFRDITERKKAEETIHREQLFTDTLLESLPGIFYLYKYPEFQLVRWNKNHETFFGFSTEEMKNRYVLDWFQPEFKDAVLHTVNNVIDTGYSMVEAPILAKDGNIIPFMLPGTRLDTPENVYFMGVGLDITERKRAEEKLKAAYDELIAVNEEIMAINEEFEAANEELIATNCDLTHAQDELKLSESKYRTLVENLSAGMIVFNPGSEIIFYNPVAAAILGFEDGTRADAAEINRAWQVLKDDGAVAPGWDYPLNQVLLTGEPLKNIIIRGASPDTRPVWLLCDAYPVRGEFGEIKQVVCTFVDITGRKLAEDEINRLKNYVTSIIDSDPDIVVGLDREMKITLLNRKAEMISGMTASEAAGLPLKSVLNDFAMWIEPVINRFSGNKPLSRQGLIVDTDGERRFYDLVIYPLFGPGAEGSVLRIIDTTDIVRKEEQFRQAQKMETVGTLASGLAHNFNNVLSGIVGTASLVKHIIEREKTVSGSFSNYIDIIDRSGKRAAEMVQQLLALSRKSGINLTQCDLNESVKNVMQICRNTFDKSVEIITEYAPGKAMILGDPSQMEQVLLNLCLNAAHAMTLMRKKDEGAGGTLIVSLRSIIADRFFCSVHSEAVQGRYWMVSHSDTGVGIHPDNLNKIFDPFFSTKESEFGTGLGLAMVYNIIHQHNGFITVYSEQGTGSTFNVYLPELSPGDGNGIETADTSVKRGEGLILVIDDEETVRFIAESLLRECGYDVILAGSGREGIEKFRESKDSIKAVLLDMAMPGMSGKEVYPELKKLRPDVKVLLASGFRQDGRVQETISLGIEGFIQKPYSLAELSRKIHGIIY